ncbi:MAG: hypothetical protein QNJ98_01075 [Planctomycetota bacterium]|nr:hypothetical protein [Planctomycetota bacterium]
MEPDRPEMSQPPEAYVPPPKAASLGNILGDSISVYARHCIPILIVSAAVFVPFAYLQNLGWRRLAEQPDFILRLRAGETGQSVWLPIVSFCLQFVLQGFVIYIVVQHLSGRRPGLGAALSAGIQRMIPALGVVVCIVLCFVPLFLPVYFAPGLLLVMFIPIIVVGCGLFVAIAASVMERPGIVGALGRSWELTKGRRGTIFLLLFVVMMILRVVTQVIERSVLRGGWDSLLQALETSTWIDTGIAAMFHSFLAVCAGVTYHHLRTSKEGAQTEELAAIFD